MDRIEPGDLVFNLVKKGSAKHRPRAIVVSIDGKHAVIRPLPRHPADERVKLKDLRLWKAKKAERMDRKKGGRP
tara:strand:+ start:120 stop:341 length:222 start_codon:yes stop_codon:yes gene_type:complete